MRLSQLLQNNYSLANSLDREITNLSLDSRKIKKNDLFLAVRGTELDGRQYIPQAIAQGAAAVLIDAESETEEVILHENVPLIPILHLRNKIGSLAAQFYGHPARQLRLLGVTGTNGKTSCTHFLAQSFEAMQIPCGIIGTLGSGFYGALDTATLTTPDAITLQATLKQLAHQGAKAVAMEVSSHSIHQGRINEIGFELGIFTNLTQDHLDYHGNMENYAAVKKRFLTDFPMKHVIINVDDDYGKKWAKEIAKEKSVYGYSIHNHYAESEFPLIFTEKVQLSLQGIKANVFTPWGNGELSLPLIGQFNLSNGLATLAALLLSNVPFTTALHLLANLHPVLGRMQMLGGGNKPLIIVDYAHTPDALQKVLSALCAHTKGKLFCVFGCGGDRDHGKRPKMAKIVESLADQIIVTNDNPRHENPEDIAAQIMQGFSHPERVFVELNRSKAIQKSIQWASVSDCILIAGKGAERFQQIGDEKIPFDDVKEVMTNL